MNGPKAISQVLGKKWTQLAQLAKLRKNVTVSSSLSLWILETGTKKGHLEAAVVADTGLSKWRVLVFNVVER